MQTIYATQKHVVRFADIILSSLFCRRGSDVSVLIPQLYTSSCLATVERGFQSSTPTHRNYW